MSISLIIMDYSNIVKSIYNNYSLGNDYKISNWRNTIDINIIIGIILNEYRLHLYIRRNRIESYKNTKYYGLMHYVYELLQKCSKEDFNNLIENTSYLEILSEINNGAIILYKLKKSINITKTKKLEYCYLSANNGSYNTFKFWYDDEINNLIKNYSEINNLMITKSVINPDDRIYKFMLEKTQFNLIIIKNIILCLDTALNIPIKYKIKRIKMLSKYINISEHFTDIIYNLYDYRLITYLHKIIKHNHDYNMILYLYNNIKQTHIYRYKIIIKNLYNYLNDREKSFLLICIGYNIINPELEFSSSIRNLIKEYYKPIILNLLKKNNLFKINNNTIKILCEEKLFNKYLLDSTQHPELLLFTRFYSNDNSTNKDFIKYNKLLHLLRLKMKKFYNNKLNGFLNKVYSLNKEISNYKPRNISVLKNGSKNYQYNKQKFTNIPPRHLIATLSKNIITELQVYTMFLLREKPDGILVSTLPNNIYPKTDIFNYKIKAEYIEDHDLYLVFDIDIPNTTIIERYDLLRKAHPYTNKTNLEQINNLNDFMLIMTRERELINDFMKEKPKIKWYPKFATLYNNNDNSQIVNNFIDFINTQNDNFRYSILDFKYYNCDGLILSPLINYSREIKIKPNSLLTIDLLYNGKYFVDYENNNMNYLLFIDGKEYTTNTIYRCYPDVFNNKFIIGEIRFDKYKANKNNIITNICNLLVYKYTNFANNNEIKQEIYYEKKGELDYNLLQQIKEQTNLLNNILLYIDPKDNKRWLDLGSGSSKLSNYIQKFIPDYYLGIDSDINKLIDATKDNNINVIHTDLNTPWSILIDDQLKFDYIVANFSIMHFFSDIFWEQLNKISKSGTIFIFNVPSDNWKYKNSHMNIDNGFVYYNFEWVHINKDNKKEPYIDKKLIYDTVEKYKWSINVYHDKPYTNKNNNKLVDCYSWFILSKN